MKKNCQLLFAYFKLEKFEWLMRKIDQTDFQKILLLSLLYQRQKEKKTKKRRDDKELLALKKEV